MSESSAARRIVSRLRRSSGVVFQIGATVLFFLVLPVAADAYTLVLRDGRRVNVPADFKVTPSAVVYEASPGFTVTVWLSNVDVETTERVNSEPAGSFAKRIRQETGGTAAPSSQAARTGRSPGRKVVTNKELEPLRLRREAQEEEYERTHRERGMPSRAELQRRIEEQDRKLREWAERMEAEREAAEVESLKSELSGVRRQLDELSLHLSRQTAAHASAYTYASDYPYVYAPSAQLVTVLTSGRHGRFGRRRFGLHPFGFRPSGLHTHGRPHTPHARHIHPRTPIFVAPSRGAGALPRHAPPSVRPPTRPR